MVQVNNNTPITLRVKFYKTGNLQYISHLDLVRTMMKVIVRAKLPLWYTEGFNPKPKITFAAPLSIGTESMCEFMDIRLTEKMDVSLAKQKLNENMTDEMQATDVYYPTDKLTALKWLGYEIVVSSNSVNEENLKKCNEMFASESLVVLKKTKSGENDVDIKPLIKSAFAEIRNEKLYISCVLSADSSQFLNPEYIVKLLRERCGMLTSENLTEESYTIIRTNAYKEDMSLFR